MRFCDYLSRLVNVGIVATSAGFAATALGTTPATGEVAPTRPNIVVIMADDMGFSDLGCYGGEINTPNLDRLAAEGLLFTQFYNTARCCPTRASLLTGLYAHRAGIGGMIRAKRGGTNTVSPYQGYLNDSCVTVAEVLATAGYRTLMSGKWHVGENRPNWPTDRGFEEYFGLISGACNYWKLDKKRKMAINGKPYFPPDDGTFYMTDAFTDHAVDMIDRHAGGADPFLLYVTYTAPHWPLHAWPADIEKYRGKYMMGWDRLRRERHERMIRMGLVDKNWPLSPLDAKPWDTLGPGAKKDFDLKMAVYAAMVDRMDQGVGRILAKLQETGAADNTVVMFLADNGGCAENPDYSEVKGTPPGPKEGFLAYGRNWANASNTPFRKYKKWVHEGGIATPLIVRWPGVVEPGTVTHQVGHVIDIPATAIDIAGAKYPRKVNGKKIHALDGRSLLPVLNGKERNGRRVIYWEHFGNRAVRDGDWKLVAVRKKPWELYNLKNDRTELNDLSGKYPRKASSLRRKYEKWAKDVGARGGKKSRRK